MSRKPGLLVSVRSAEEARAAVAGGARVVDVKEPDSGPLGMADPEVWRSVREAVPAGIAVSVALGELAEWIDRPPPPRDAFAGIAFRKMGLSGLGADWAAAWSRLRREWGDGPPWIAVIYADWRAVGAPSPDEVIAEAANAGCAGVLIDTWGKARGRALDLSWADRMRRIRQTVGLIALAGGLDAEGIAELAPLAPDLFAVRGSACEGGDRRGRIEAARVARLAEACRGSVER